MGTTNECPKKGTTNGSHEWESYHAQLLVLTYDIMAGKVIFRGNKTMSQVIFVQYAEKSSFTSVKIYIFSYFSKKSTYFTIKSQYSSWKAIQKTVFLGRSGG